MFKKTGRCVIMCLKTEAEFQLQPHVVILVHILCCATSLLLPFFLNAKAYLLISSLLLEGIKRFWETLHESTRKLHYSFFSSITVEQILDYFTCQFSLVFPVPCPFPELLEKFLAASCSCTYYTTDRLAPVSDQGHMQKQAKIL